MKEKIILLIIAILILIVSVPVNANTYIPDPPYDAYDYWVVTDTYGQIKLYTSPNPIYVKTDSKGTLNLRINKYKRYVLVSGQWSFETEKYDNIVLADFNTIYASNHDIEYFDGSGFFFTLPKVPVLCQIVRQMKQKGVFGIILRTFSAGLIPLVGLIVLGQSLRKGWDFFRSRLMH